MNGLPKNYTFEEFYNYHKTPGHLTTNCKTLRNIIQDLIDQKAIWIDETPKQEEEDVGPVHPNNGQLGIFTNPLPKITQQPRGCI